MVLAQNRHKDQSNTIENPDWTHKCMANYSLTKQERVTNGKKKTVSLANGAGRMGQQHAEE